MKIALISLNQRWEDKEANMQRCKQLAINAAAQGAQLAIFPEMTLTGFTFNIDNCAEDPNHSPTLEAFAELAKEQRLVIVIGLILKTGEGATNTLVAFDHHGVEQARYSKIHPFSFAGEDRVFEAGNRLAEMKVGEFLFGFSICYDLRFPEIYSSQSKNCNALVNIANWPKRRIHHWKTLLQARAIENQVYVIGVNRIGTDGNDLCYEESSMIIDANGNEVMPYHRENELVIIKITNQDLAEFRRNFPTRQDRRPKLYRTLI